MSISFENLSPRPAILQVIPSLNIGGAERTTIDMARAIIAAGGRAVVASSGGRLLNELIAAGGEHVDMDVHSKNPIIMALNVERLTRLAEREKIDLIHARSRAPAWSALAAAHRLGLPFVTTYHSKVHEAPRLKVFYNSVMTRGDAVIANSSYTAERIGRVHAPDPARLFVVPRGVDTDYLDEAAVEPERMAALRLRWNILDDGRAIFLLPARISRWKGQKLAIQAAADLLSSGVTGFRLLLVGDAQGRNAFVKEVQDMIGDPDLARHVALVGHCDDMAAAYALSDVVLSPSIEAEPFGRVAVEAQSMRRPVIVSDAGGQRETVLTPEMTGGIENATGLAVEPNDAKALAAAMKAVLELTPEARRGMGERGRANALAHYSVGAMTGATLDVYARLIARSRDKRSAAKHGGAKRGG
ncbi:glycosyltransferase family 4 protein [Parvibaculum sedimenti]|uniref:glycosyltransferase family 4 protein n=1 Tax=Parvibaculum sedimenti TaxID=2608632 RepID=UPI001FEA75DF|nr:glycosyltransferase family 4 protein [Parvibaculum sedimenti]